MYSIRTKSRRLSREPHGPTIGFSESVVGLSAFSKPDKLVKCRRSVLRPAIIYLFVFILFWEKERTYCEFAMGKKNKRNSREMIPLRNTPKAIPDRAKPMMEETANGSARPADNLTSPLQTSGAIQRCCNFLAKYSGVFYFLLGCFVIGVFFMIAFWRCWAASPTTSTCDDRSNLTSFSSDPQPPTFSPTKPTSDESSRNLSQLCFGLEPPSSEKVSYEECYELQSSRVKDQECSPRPVRIFISDLLDSSDEFKTSLTGETHVVVNRCEGSHFPGTSAYTCEPTPDGQEDKVLYVKGRASWLASETIERRVAKNGTHTKCEWK